MFSMIRSEWYQARKSFAVWLVFILTIVITIMLQYSTIEYYREHSQAGLTFGGNMCSTMQDTAMCLLYASLFSGLMIGGSFENRTIQGAIASGKKRTYVYLSKMFLFLAVFAVQSLAYWLSGSVMVSSLQYGFGTEELVGNLCKPAYLIGMVAACLLADTSLATICGLVGFLVRKPGVIIATCMVVILVGGNFLATVLPESILQYLSYTPLRLMQNVLKYDLTWRDIGMTSLLSILWIVAVLGVGIWKFRRTELK